MADFRFFFILTVSLMWSLTQNEGLTFFVRMEIKFLHDLIWIFDHWSYKRLKFCRLFKAYCILLYRRAIRYNNLFLIWRFFTEVYLGWANYALPIKSHLKVIYCRDLRLICLKWIQNHHFRTKNSWFLTELENSWSKARIKLFSLASFIQS